jgi:hypothetical protein
MYYMKTPTRRVSLSSPAIDGIDNDGRAGGARGHL